jgi:Anti-sigma factor NepR
VSVEQNVARNTEHGLALVGMARDLAPTDLNAVGTGIGAELRMLHSDLLREEIPDRMAELLKRLDQLNEAGRNNHQLTGHRPAVEVAGAFFFAPCLR